MPAYLAGVIVEAYRRKTSLGNAFDHYRAMQATAEWIGNWAQSQRLTTQTLAIGGGVIGAATTRQLEPITGCLDRHLLEDCGHITPIDQPDAFADLLIEHARVV